MKQRKGWQERDKRGKLVHHLWHDEELTFEEIGGILGITKQRAHQILDSYEPLIPAEPFKCRHQEETEIRRGIFQCDRCYMVRRG